MHQSYYDEEYSQNNRQKVLNPKKGFAYCGCDKVRIGAWSKCPLCHRRNGRKRFKK